jgi:hypothetical protein
MDIIRRNWHEIIAQIKAGLRGSYINAMQTPHKTQDKRSLQGEMLLGHLYGGI